MTTCIRCAEPALPGLARCAEHERRRRAALRHMRRRLARELAQRQATSNVCQFRLGVAVCGGALGFEVLRDGRTAVRCAWCDRRKRGICRDCPRPVAGTVGRALRCAACRDRERSAAQDRYREAHEAVIARRLREYIGRPDVRAARNEYKRLRRKARPDITKREKRKALLSDGASRAHYLAWRRRYNRKKARQVPPLHLLGRRPRTCMVRGCATVIAGRRKKCDACRVREQAEAAALLAQRTTRTRRSA